METAMNYLPGKEADLLSCLAAVLGGSRAE